MMRAYSIDAKYYELELSLSSFKYRHSRPFGGWLNWFKMAARYQVSLDGGQTGREGIEDLLGVGRMQSVGGVGAGVTPWVE